MWKISVTLAVLGINYSISSEIEDNSYLSWAHLKKNCIKGNNLEVGV